MNNSEPQKPGKEGKPAGSDNASLLRVLNGERVDPPPVWIMRQAGRYLPEYRELRARAKSFLDFCYAPAMATEAVLQPLRRFPLDAAILFSDILVIPDALGRKVSFVEGEGPRLEPLIAETDWRLGAPAQALDRLSPVYEAVERIKTALPASTPLIGFCGGPWTVATYMLQGRGGEKDEARRASYLQHSKVDALLDVLVEASALHLAQQVKAGADCLQIFESWSEGLPKPLFERLILGPTKRLMVRLRTLGVTVPVIGFPRGCGAHLGRYARETGITALGVDTATPAAFAREQAPNWMALQGNLDPQLVVAGGHFLSQGVRGVREAFKESPHIFNLGHGVTPDATPENVAELVRLVKEPL
jgi:uroporphyrinogen decarboxylase